MKALGERMACCQKPAHHHIRKTLPDDVKKNPSRVKLRTVSEVFENEILFNKRNLDYIDVGAFVLKCTVKFYSLQNFIHVALF